MIRQTHTNRRARGFTLLELIISMTLLTTLVGAISVVLRGSFSSWQAHVGDYAKVEAAQATVRHIIRNVRQATLVSAISASGNTAGTLSVSMPSGQTYAWAHNGGTSEVNFGVTTATNLLAEGISSLTFTGYRADGTTATTTVSEIQVIKCQAQIQLPRDTGGLRTVTAWAWLRAY